MTCLAARGCDEPWSENGEKSGAILIGMRAVWFQVDVRGHILPNGIAEKEEGFKKWGGFLSAFLNKNM
jgi:hypothetical protein